MEIHNVFNNFSVLIRKLRRHHTQIHKPTTPRFDSNSPRRTGINRILPAHQLFDETPTFVKINPPIKLTNRTNKIHRASLWYHYLRCKHNQPTSKKNQSLFRFYLRVRTFNQPKNQTEEATVRRQEIEHKVNDQTRVFHRCSEKPDDLADEDRDHDDPSVITGLYIDRRCGPVGVIIRSFEELVFASFVSSHTVLKKVSVATSVRPNDQVV